MSNIIKNLGNGNSYKNGFKTVYRDYRGDYILYYHGYRIAKTDNISYCVDFIRS